MTWEQRCALTRINAIFGSLMMTSDNVATYDPAKREIFEEALQLFYHAEPISVMRMGTKIKIRFHKGGSEYQIAYDPTAGVIRWWPRNIA